MQKTKWIGILFFLSLFLCCGKKLPPTSPDRWAPKVLNIKPEDKHHIRVFFSERVDTISPQKLGNYRIVNPETAETTAIIYAERTKKGDEVLLTIPELEERKYLLQILSIRDLKGNKMKIAERGFTPSKDLDTISPLLKYTKPSRSLTSAALDSVILIRFSEPMDTSTAGLMDFVTTNIVLDTVFIWNATLTEVIIHYRLMQDKIGKIFILPRMPDLSGNPLGELRILTLTTHDTIPKNRMNITITRIEGKAKEIYAFLSFPDTRMLQDIVSVDTTFECSFYFASPDTYLVSIIAENPDDTTGFWWGEEKILFFPDTSRSMDVLVGVEFRERKIIPYQLMNVFELLNKNVKRR